MFQIFKIAPYNKYLAVEKLLFAKVVQKSVESWSGVQI
jgi:hypothetical protein